MTLTPFDQLPVLLVSAKSKEEAATIISDIVEEDVSAEYADGAGPVWRIRNKYYTADVRLRVRTDADPAPSDAAPAPSDADPAPSDADPAPPPEAHLIHLADDECTAECAARRAGAAGATGAAGVPEVRVVCADTGGAGAALRQWAARTRHALYELRAPPEPPACSAAAAVRAALQAHAWPGLRRAAPAAAPPAAPVRRHERPPTEGEVEQFGAALAALGEARASLQNGGGGGGGPGGGGRLDTAEALLAAVCRALGHSIDEL